MPQMVGRKLKIDGMFIEGVLRYSLWPRDVRDPSTARAERYRCDVEYVNNDPPPHVFWARNYKLTPDDVLELEDVLVEIRTSIEDFL